MVGGTVPVIERFQDIRVAVAVIGPGLPTAGIAQLPAEVQAQVPAGMGVHVVPGEPDQSTCHFTDDPLSTGQLTGEAPYGAHTNAHAPFAANFTWGPRCHYHEDWAGSDMWVVQDELVALNQTGEHYLVYWAPGDQVLGAPTTTAKFGIVFGDVGQSEEFSGVPVDVGECAQPSEDFYEMACHSPPPPAPAWVMFLPPAQRPRDECEPSTGVAVPNYYLCPTRDASNAHLSAFQPLCNSLCHNHGGACFAAGPTPLGPSECAFNMSLDGCVESCAHLRCGVEAELAVPARAPWLQGPVGAGCSLGCTHGATGPAAVGCSEECLGDFSNHHHGAATRQTYCT